MLRKTCRQIGHAGAAKHNAIGAIIRRARFQSPCRCASSASVLSASSDKHRQFGRAHARAALCQAIPRQIVLYDRNGARQRRDNRKTRAEHAGRMKGGLADTDHRRTRDAARGIEPGVVEAGDDMRVDPAGLLRFRDARQQSRHGKGAVVKPSIEAGPNSGSVATILTSAARRPSRRAAIALRHGRGRVRVDNMKTQCTSPFSNESPILERSTLHERSNLAQAQSGDQSRAALGRHHGNRADRRYRERRHLPPDADRSRPRRCATGSRRAPRRSAARSRSTTWARCSRDGPGSGTIFRRSPWAAISIPSRRAENSTACSAFSAALEALRTMHEAGYETFAPIEVVNFTNEEGSRFAPAMIASGVFAGVFERKLGRAQKDRSGISFGEALAAIGYCGGERLRRSSPLRLFRTAYRARSRSSKTSNKDIGIVTDVQGMRWYEATLIGQEAHTGATPMRLRKNALLGAARMVEAVDRDRARAPAARGRTVGLIEVKPNSRNVIPGEVFFTVDFRHPARETCSRPMERQMHAAFAAMLSRVCRSTGTLTRIWDQPPVAFDRSCVDVGSSGRRRIGICRRRDIISGAGHDAAYISRVAPVRDDLRSLSRRHQPQRGGIFVQGAMRARARRSCCRRSSTTIASWPSNSPDDI